MPYPGTELYEKAKRAGWLTSEDWSRMEYSYYQMHGNGLDEKVVLDRDQSGEAAVLPAARATRSATSATSSD